MRIRIHLVHARNEFWSSLMTVSFPFACGLGGVLPRNFVIALQAGWVVGSLRAAAGGLQAVSGNSVFFSKRKLFSWELYNAGLDCLESHFTMAPP